MLESNLVNEGNDSFLGIEFAFTKCFVQIKKKT